MSEQDAPNVITSIRIIKRRLSHSPFACGIPVRHYPHCTHPTIRSTTRLSPPSHRGVAARGWPSRPAAALEALAEPYCTAAGSPKSPAHGGPRALVSRPP